MSLVAAIALRTPAESRRKSKPLNCGDSIHSFLLPRRFTSITPADTANCRPESIVPSLDFVLSNGAHRDESPSLRVACPVATRIYLTRFATAKEILREARRGLA